MGIFQPKSRNGKIIISRIKSSWSLRHWQVTYNPATGISCVVKNGRITNLRWRRPPSWKMHKSQLLIDLHQIWYAYRYGQYKCRQGSKMSLFENSRWRRCHLGKYTKGHISANSWSICTKFGVLVDTGNISVTSGPKCHFLRANNKTSHNFSNFFSITDASKCLRTWR